MSVSFYDPNNPAKYNEDGDQVGGGIEINVNNSNGYSILMLMGLCGPDNRDMYGDLDGDTFRKCCIKALCTIDMMTFNVQTIENLDFWMHIESRINRLLVVFSDADRICWS